MQGKDQHDSSCVDFSKLRVIRNLERVMSKEVDAPGILEGLTVGVLDEFQIEELDERNRGI